MVSKYCIFSKDYWPYQRIRWALCGIVLGISVCTPRTRPDWSPADLASEFRKITTCSEKSQYLINTLHVQM